MTTSPDARPLSDEAVEAAIAERERWDTGSSARAGRPVEWSILRLNDEGQYETIEVYDSRDARDEAFDRMTERAALTAAIPHMRPAAEPVGETLPEGFFKKQAEEAANACGVTPYSDIRVFVEVAVDYALRAQHAAAPTTPASPDDDRLREVVEALEPFAEFGRQWTDENGWSTSIHRERLSTWFGPSDFRRARTALANLRASREGE